MWKRWGALLLAAVMTLSLLPASALAVDREEAPVDETPVVLDEAPVEEVPEALPEEADQPAEPAAQGEPGMQDQTSNGLTVSFVQYLGYEGFGEDRTEVQKDDLTLIAAQVTWTAVAGATGYTVDITSDEHQGLANSGDNTNVWYQDNTARTVRLTNLHPGKTYTVTVTAQGVTASGSMTFTTKTATNALAAEAAADPEAPAAWGAIPDDNQLKYHDTELAAFIHYGPNTFNNRSWGTGAEKPSEFAPTDLNQEVVDNWVKQFKDAGFKRLIFVAKHHDGFCLWFSQYTEHDLEAEDSGYKYDLLEQVSKACTEYDMDMGFYISPWDAYETPGSHNPDGKYGTEAYNEHYLNTLREVLDSKANGNKYGNNGKFVEVWMDGAKGSNVSQSNDFDTWFQLIHELQPECVIFSPRADGGVRWVGNEGGYSGSNPEKTDKGDISWQKVDPKNQVVSDTLTHNICDPAESPRFTRQYGKPDGVLWSVNECDVSIESEWFWHPYNTLRTMETLATMYFETVGYGSPLLLNTPPTTTGPFASATASRLAEFGREVQNSFKTDLAAGKTATAGSTRTSNSGTKFAAANVVDENPDNYWTMNDAAWTAWTVRTTKTPGSDGSASITVDLGETTAFDVISIQEYIPLGQRIISGVAEYHDADGWHEFGTFHTVGARRLIRTEPVSGDQIRVTINEAYAVPLIRSIGVFKMTRGMSLRSGIPEGLEYIDDRDSAVTYIGNKNQYNNNDGFSNTHTGLNNTTSTVSVTFTGTKFYVVGIKDPNHGPVELVIDGGDPITFETHASGRARKQILYVSEDLAPGEHTIVMKAKTGTYGGENKTFFDFDGIYYLPEGMSMLDFEAANYTAFPSSTVDLKVTRCGDTTKEITFKFSDQPGTAIQGDYVQMGGTYTMAAGVTEQIITMETTAGAVSGGSPIGKTFYGVLADPTGGAILGFVSEAMVTIVDPDTFPQEPKGETYTAEDPFNLPTKVGKSRKLEAEHMVLDGSGAASGKHVRIQDDAGASGGKKVGWFEPGNKVFLHYNAPRTGTYTLTLRYESGRTDANNLNTLNWREASGKVQPYADSIPGTMQGSSLTYGEEVLRETFVVTEAGPGVLEFYADAKASPNIDWFSFELVHPTDGVQSVTIQPTVKTLYLNGATGEDMFQFTAETLPAELEVTNLVWRSSDPDVAYVRQDGTVGARSNGTATITVTAGEEGEEVTAEATVTVKTRVTGEVAISGTPKFGQLLTASVNQLSHQGAKEDLTYQWNRNGTAISGATQSTYTVAEADIGQEITVTITASGGYVGSKTSAAVRGEKAEGPEVVATLDYTDCTEAGNDGKITGLNSQRAYQYKLVSAGEEAWTDIPGTPGATELTGLAPGSYHVRVKETATNTAGPVSRTLTILAYNAPGFDISIGTFANGRVTASVRRAVAGATVTLTALPETGYQLTEGSLKVTGASGDVAVSADGTFTMPGEAVTVTAAFALRQYTIDHQLTNINCSMAQHDHQVTYGEKPTITLTPAEGYTLPQTVTIVKKDGSPFTGYRYTHTSDGSTGTIAFTVGIDDDLRITGAGVAKTFTVTYNITHLLATQAPRTLTYGTDLVFTLEPDEGYTLPAGVRVTVGGTALASTAYSYSANGTVTVAAAHIRANVTITAEGLRKINDLKSVRVTGTVRAGQRLEAVVVPIGATALYQWISVDGETETEISGATYPQYMLTPNEVGKMVRVRVTGNGGYGGTQLSDPVGPVLEGPADREAIQAACEAAQAIENENYTDASWDAFQKAIAAAQAVLDDPAAMYSQGQKALADLAAAQEGLTKKPTPGDQPGPSISGNISPSGGQNVEEKKEETRPDGTTVTVERDKEGTVTETVVQPDGTKTEAVTTKEGDMTITVTDADGEAVAKVELPAILPTPETRFVDIPETHWADEAIHHAAALELVQGTGGNKFDPTAGMTRGSLATVLYRLSNGEAGTVNSFLDVSNADWYAAPITWAAKSGIVTGYSMNTFAPDDVITREQLATMLARYAKLLGMDTAADAGALDSFPDGANTNSWAQDGVAWCVKAGIIRGTDTGSLIPNNQVSRAEVAVMLERFIGLLQK